MKWNFSDGSYYIRIGCVEIFYSSKFELGHIDFGCECYFYSLGWFGFGIIRGEHL